MQHKRERLVDRETVDGSVVDDDSTVVCSPHLPGSVFEGRHDIIFTLRSRGYGGTCHVLPVCLPGPSGGQRRKVPRPSGCRSIVSVGTKFTEQDPGSLSLQTFGPACPIANTAIACTGVERMDRKSTFGLYISTHTRS